MALAGTGCSGDEGYYLYWSGRSYEAGGEPGKAGRVYLRVLERFPDQKDPSTGVPYSVRALARGLVTASGAGDPSLVRAFLDSGEVFLDGRLKISDEQGDILTSAPGRALGTYCLVRALAKEGDMGAASVLLRESEVPGEGTFMENGTVRFLPAAWAELVPKIIP